EWGWGDAAVVAVGQGLVREHFDDVIGLLLLVAADNRNLPAGLAAAGDIHVGENVALPDVEFDWSSLPPQKLRTSRQRIVVVAIGRRGKKHRERSVAGGHVERHGNLNAVVHADLDLARPQTLR